MQMPPPTVAMYPPPAPMYMQPVSRRGPLLLWGSVLRIVGALIAGLDLIWLGIWVSNPAGSVSLLNPMAPFQTLGAMIAIWGIAVIFTGIGWSLQNWARGL